MAARKPDAQEPEVIQEQAPIETPDEQPQQGDVEAAQQGVEHDPADAAVDLTAGEKGAEPAFIPADDAE